MAERLRIAVDGPAGAGKGTVCRAVARRYQWAYLDTGAIYRAVALHALNSENFEETSLAQWAAQMDFRFEVDAQGDAHAFLEGTEVTNKLRDEQVGETASQVAAMPAVRTALLDFQRNYGSPQSVILDGRDVGTVVLPDADLKIYLTASLQARAQRRTLELQGKGESVSMDRIKSRIEERDARDQSRATAPLAAAPDAQTVDTTYLSQTESIETVARLVASLLEKP
ncbi:cytidylate kinase [Magnetococcus marinus MC-1]|uniref:Cytidylate kinase n=1 Tax=Magnetococcus marinus (strain ATCC BAA-1437 / JCM 17883 / MC-1) TaxID=156889 RepID=KCY_MAGMM|nr:(d)CMP kinase [Magnetococcus marinus]A0L407.1 RecName: Full=Cytidylate kinase; Short=CK; AltName: Full=Cytidine monophosphate kinase; Short=CMP kinase [Magnetococcus marinus MC-1]ABK42700.1 cytidylate kinase [Magnetococcus marinus MC-1]